MEKAEWIRIRMALPDQVRTALNDYIEEMENYVDSRVNLEVDSSLPFDADSKDRMLGALFNLMMLVRTIPQE